MPQITSPRAFGVEADGQLADDRFDDLPDSRDDFGELRGRIGALAAEGGDQMLVHGSQAPLQIERSLRELVDAQLIIPHGQPPEAVYVFKHALVQEAAYGSLLRERRSAIHLKLADVLEKDPANVEAAHPQTENSGSLPGTWARQQLRSRLSQSGSAPPGPGLPAPPL